MMKARETTVLQGGAPLFYIGMGVMRMKHFDFKDLMAFGMEGVKFSVSMGKNLL